MYINGHFCYAFKFGILTNGLGIVRDISFFNKDFLDAHPDIVVGNKSDSPDENKSLADSKALIPVPKDFFQKHPLISPKTFLGDAAFDSIEIYKYLLQEASFEKAYIPLNGRISLPESNCPFNEKWHSLLSERSFPANEAGRKQIPPALRTSYYEVCMSQNEMGT